MATTPGDVADHKAKNEKTLVVDAIRVHRILCDQLSRDDLDESYIRALGEGMKILLLDLIVRRSETGK